MANRGPNKIVRMKLERRKQFNQLHLMMSINKRELENETKVTTRAKK